MRITLTGIAKYMTSSSAQQRKVLRDYKYPDPEGTAQAAYYRDAYNSIRDYHRNRQGIHWLLSQADDLDDRKQTAPTQQAQIRITHNAQAIRHYSTHFGHRTIQCDSPLSMTYSYAGVLIRVTPDLNGTERGHQRLLKIQFARSSDPDKHAKIVGQIMMEAASLNGLQLRGSSVRVWDCHTGADHQARVRSRIKAEIEAACQNIAAIWPHI